MSLWDEAKEAKRKREIRNAIRTAPFGALLFGILGAIVGAFIGAIRGDLIERTVWCAIIPIGFWIGVGLLDLYFLMSKDK